MRTVKLRRISVSVRPEELKLNAINSKRELIPVQLVHYRNHNNEFNTLFSSCLHFHMPQLDLCTCRTSCKIDIELGPCGFVLCME